MLGHNSTSPPPPLPITSRVENTHPLLMRTSNCSAMDRRLLSLIGVDGVVTLLTHCRVQNCPPWLMIWQDGHRAKNGSTTSLGRIPAKSPQQRDVGLTHSMCRASISQSWTVTLRSSKSSLSCRGYPQRTSTMRMRREFSWGGRKNLPIQYIFSSEDHQRYTLQLDSLVLVMLLEAISADGAAVPPLFVLPKGQVNVDDLGLPGIGR